MLVHHPHPFPREVDTVIADCEVACARAPADVSEQSARSCGDEMTLLHPRSEGCSSRDKEFVDA
jgi:hypothetical protein